MSHQNNFSLKKIVKKIYITQTITALSGSYKNVQLKNDVGMDIVALAGFLATFHKYQLYTTGVVHSKRKQLTFRNVMLHRTTQI